MGLWQKLKDVFVRPEGQLAPEDDDAIAIVPYPKPDAAGPENARQDDAGSPAEQ